MYFLYYDDTNKNPVCFEEFLLLQEHLYQDYNVNNIQIVKPYTYVRNVGLIQTSKFELGDIVVDFNADKYEVVGYYHDQMTNRFLVKCGVNLGKINENISYIEESELDFLIKTNFKINIPDGYEIDLDSFSPDNKPDTSSNCSCGKHNPDCVIVESFTGIGGSLGDQFLYCRTHDKEVK